MSRVLVTASLIVKNEERFLGDCLSSLKGVADETVVVDTGSTDRTREIAREAGARVHEFPWNGDFSAARNRALDLSTGEWILYIDADERVRGGSAQNLRAQLSSPAHLGYEVLLHPRPNFSPYLVLRLFRNYPSIRFRGVIHENMWPAVEEYRAQHGGLIGESDLVLDHEGYEDDPETKHDRNLPLLLAGVKENPYRVYSWCHLASIYRDRKQTELAKEAFEKGLGVARMHPISAPDYIMPYLGVIEIAVNNNEDADDLLAEAFGRFPDNPQLVWWKARSLLNKGEFAEAIGWFERLVVRGKNKDYDYRLSCDLRLFDQFAFEGIANCYFRLGRYAESRRNYELASGYAPEKLEYRVKQSLCYRLETNTAQSASL